MIPFNSNSNDCSCWSSYIRNNAALNYFYNRYMLLSGKGTAWQTHIPFLLSKGVDIKHFKGLEKNLKNAGKLHRYISNLEELLAYQEHDVLSRASIIRKHAGNENSKFYALCKWFLSRDQRIYRNTICRKDDCNDWIPF
tara:strand:+ start:202 stop:618 length:417 start_codon:yes stop_codon:yes gene_type:complete